MPTSKELDWAGGKEMSGDFEIFSEEYWRRRSEETKKKNKTKEVEWTRCPLRGVPVKGTGKHRFDNGDGRPICTLRWRGGRWGGKLIGGRSGYAGVPDWVKEGMWVRQQVRGRADSSEMDGTFVEFEAEIERRLLAEEAFQEMHDEPEIIESKSNMIYAHVDPASLQDIEAYEKGELEVEDLGLEDEFEDEDEGEDDGEVVDESLLEQEGLRVKRFDEKLGRPVVATLSVKRTQPVIEDSEEQLFEDPLGSLIGERLEWHNPNWFVPVDL